MMELDGIHICIKLIHLLNKIRIFALLALMVISLGFGSSSIQNSRVYGNISVMPTPLWTPVLIGKSTVPPHSSEFLSYTLQRGRTYHIFLVGNWTEPSPSSTDYDVYVSGPNGEYYRFTESSGLPEQVFNDGNGQFFTPKSTGFYHFEIHNDSENKSDAESAVFMLIEHVETDRLYNATLLGRTSLNGPYPPLSQYTYACEFTTNATSFMIHVDTPSDMDLYEARVYKMATLGSYGHDLHGLPTPTGPDLISGNVTNGYGGYNFLVNGTRPELYASCYDYGVKVNIDASQNSTEVGAGSLPASTYFLVLIAEYSKTGNASVVPFYIRTNNSTPSPTLGKPLGPVYSGELTKFYVNVTSTKPVVRTWANFTVNDAPINDVVNLTAVGKGYEGVFPAFSPKDTVKYSVCAEDELGNIGKYDSSFSVKARTVTQCNILSPTIIGGESLDLYGFTTVKNSDILLNFVNSKYKENATVKCDENGVFQYSYTPKKPGNWTVVASYDGDASNYPSNSSSIIFNMTPQLTKISCSLPSSEVKVNQSLKLVGSTTPAVAGLVVNVLFSSSVQKYESNCCDKE